jgi:hypothetical protein
MCAQKNIIKASTIKMTGAKVEKVNITDRKFGNNIFKDVPISEGAVELEAVKPAEGQKDESGTRHGSRRVHQRASRCRSWRESGLICLCCGPQEYA